MLVGLKDALINKQKALLKVDKSDSGTSFKVEKLLLTDFVLLNSDTIARVLSEHTNLN